MRFIGSSGWREEWGGGGGGPRGISGKGVGSGKNGAYDIRSFG